MTVIHRDNRCRRGYRVGRSAQAKWRSAPNPGRSGAAELPEVVDRGTHQRLAGEFPASGAALRPLALNLRRVHSYRLLHDRPTEGYTIEQLLD